MPSAQLWGRYKEADSMALGVRTPSPVRKRETFRSGSSLVAQWLRLWVPNTGGLGSIPDQETGSHVLQLKIPRATTKTWHSQINKYNLFFSKFRSNFPAIMKHYSTGGNTSEHTEGKTDSVRAIGFGY